MSNELSNATKTDNPESLLKEFGAGVLGARPLAVLKGSVRR